VCCTAALKNIEIIEREQLLDHVKDVGSYLEQRLQACASCRWWAMCAA
jgi:adenosylmethionine-8-amino-7-oxononanoate aminotransferase